LPLDADVDKVQIPAPRDTSDINSLQNIYREFYVSPVVHAPWTPYMPPQGSMHAPSHGDVNEPFTSSQRRDSKRNHHHVPVPSAITKLDTDRRRFLFSLEDKATYSRSFTAVSAVTHQQQLLECWS